MGGTDRFDREEVGKMKERDRPLERQEAERLKLFWNSRYQKFSLGESGIKGLPAKYSELLYRCKRDAYRKALHFAKIDLERPVATLDGGCGQGFFVSVVLGLFRH